ncbi:MAG: hypothetical protein ABIO24_10330 [Saprospiraceae bacterium]
MDKILVTIGGVYSLAFAVFHLYFWKLFRWKDQLYLLHPGNRAIVQILNVRLIYVFLCMAALCFFYRDALLETGLGHAILAGCSLFWVGRTIEQFVYLRRIYHWLVHLLTAIFVLGALIFAAALYLTPDS